MNPTSRRPGRPRRAPAPTAIHVKVAPGTYDAAFRAAARERVSVPELIRRALDVRLADETGSAAK